MTPTIHTTFGNSFIERPYELLWDGMTATVVSFQCTDGQLSVSLMHMPSGLHFCTEIVLGSKANIEYHMSYVCYFYARRSRR